MTDTNINLPIIQSRFIQSTPIKDLYIITLKQVSEERGTIREAYRHSSFRDIPVEGVGSWKQINVTESCQGVIRGIHAESMNKLVGVISGEGFGAYVDLRKDSPSKKVVFTTELRKGMQVFIPNGVGNGFQSTSEEPSQYLYCFDEEWTPGMPGLTINPLDPDLHIDWPIKMKASNSSLVSKKDISAPLLKDIFTI